MTDSTSFPMLISLSWPFIVTKHMKKKTKTKPFLSPFGKTPPQTTQFFFTQEFIYFILLMFLYHFNILISNINFKK
jgi:hypothetical protein